MALLGCEDDFVALDQDAGTLLDAGQEADAAPDLGPPPPTVSVTALVGSGTDEGVGIWAVGESESGTESVFTIASLEVHQPSGPDLIDLPGTHAVIGQRSAGASTYSWTAYSDAIDVQVLEGSEDFFWLHFNTGEPRGLNGGTTLGPKLVRVFYDGTSDSEIPVPADIGLASVGEDPTGDSWLLGRGIGPVDVDGTILGAADESVLFLTRRTPSGLVDPVLLATGSVEIDPYASARLLPDGDLLVAARSLPAGGTLAGEVVAPESSILARIDLAGPTIEERWPVSRTPEILETETGVELRVQSSGADVVIGEHTYSAIDGAWSTHVRVSWDPVAEAVIPEGETWPVYPEEVDEDGLHVGQYPGFGLAEIFTVLDPDHSVVRRVKTDGQILDRSVRWNGGVFTGVHLRDGGAGELVVESEAGSESEPLGEVVTGNQSFWVLQLDPDTGEVLHRKGYDVGPTDLDARVHAQPLTPDLFLVGIWRSDAEPTSLMVDGWELPAPVMIPVETTGAECEVWPWGQSFSVPRPPTLNSSAFVLFGRCDGPHTLSVGGGSFDFETPNSSSLFRLQVE